MRSIWPRAITQLFATAFALVLIGPAANGMAALDFTAAQSINTGPGTIGNAGVAAADMDQDGDMDLAVATCGAECGGTGNGGIVILVNNGSGSFSTPGSPIAGGLPRHVVLADVDRDGDPDLLVGDKDGFVLRLGGTGPTFGSATTFTTGPGSYTAIAATDVDLDGDLDLVTANRNIVSNNLSVRLGDGTGAFAAPTDYTVGTTPYDIALADNNNDDRPDIAVANAGSGNISYRPQSGGAYSNGLTLGAGGQPVSITAAQVTAAGGPRDLVVATRTNSFSIFVRGNHTFAKPYSSALTYPTGSASLAVASAQLEELFLEDDVVSRQQDGTYRIYSSTESFDSPLSLALVLNGTAQPSATADSTVIATDVDGDGALDLIGTNYNVASLTLFRQLPVVAASGIDFDDQAVGGRSAAQTVTVTDLGRAPLHITADTVTGADAGDFVKGADTCTGATLHKDEQCSVSIRFAPSAIGVRNAALSLTDNATGGGQTLALSGVGVEPSNSVTGPTGPAGADGGNGQNGQNGASGPQGDQGPQGAQGQDGAQGPTGPRGRAGRDARVTCKPGKRKKGRVRVTCIVRFATSGKARARLSRNGVVYAHGSGRVTRRAAALDLRTVRRTPPGEYTMRIRFGGGRLVRGVVTVR